MAGYCSRRKADQFILQGTVQVNKTYVSKPGTKIHPDRDRIKIMGKEIFIPAPEKTQYTYLALNKPRYVISSRYDPQGRKTVLDLLPQKLSEQKVVPAGRLDFMSEGLLLLSNDGDFINYITHPSFSITKTYRVRVRGDITREKTNRLQQGMILKNGERLAPVEIRRIKKGKNKIFFLELVLHQGKNRQIRRLCKDLGLTVLRLKRSSQGAVDLSKIPPGEYRHLSQREIRSFKGALNRY